MVSILYQVKAYFRIRKSFSLFHELLSLVSLLTSQCSLINARVLVVYIHVELSTYFNVRHMAFIVCVIGSRKTSLINKFHYIGRQTTATLMTFIFTHTKELQMARFAYPDGRFLVINQTQSHETAHWPLLHLVVWYGALQLFLQYTASPGHSTRCCNLSCTSPSTYPPL